jgi:heat shock protein HtpX
MITALRKIEGRGELAHANSAVMEMCIDNPRVGFSNVFDTHPSIDKRVAAIVQFAGGHDPGPLALPEPEPPADAASTSETSAPGPWGEAGEPQSGGDKPFLPARPPVELGGPAPGATEPGPWGPRGQN